MLIVLYLVAILVLSWLVGFALAIALRYAGPFSLYSVRGVRYTLPLLGFVFACDVWWVFTFALHQRDAVALIAIATVFPVAVAAWARRGFSRRAIAPLLPHKRDGVVLAVLLCIAAFAAWPYLALGIGNYVFYNDTDWFNRILLAASHGHDVVDVLSAAVLPNNPGRSGNAFFIAYFPLQASNTMLLERVFGVSANDGGVLQAIVELLFTALGTYWLSRCIFRFGVTASAAAAVLGVVAQFYFHTYLEGHIGSVIYAAAAPYFFGLGVWALGLNRFRGTLAAIALIVLFLWKAYPPVIYLLVLPLVLAKARLVYLSCEPALRSAAARLLRTRMTAARFRLVVVVAGLAVCGTGYAVAHAIFFRNRVAALLMGYDPMYIVLDKHVVEWFYGLRLNQSFGYGFLDPSANLYRYDAFANVLAVVCTAVIVVGAVVMLRRRLASFLAAFLLTLPPLVIVFATLYPFSYVVYKVMYVHYFLWVMGAAFGFSYLLHGWLRRGWRVPAVVLWCVAAALIGINAAGSVANSAISMRRSQALDPSDVAALAARARAAGVDHVAIQADHNNLTHDVIAYEFENAGLAVTRGAYGQAQVGQPLVTPQYAVLDPIAPRDVRLRSPSGKYVVSNTPNTLVEVEGYQSPEMRAGTVFRWLHSDLDYTTFSFAAEFGKIAAFLGTLPDRPVVCNDLSDSGWYLEIDQLLAQSGMRHSLDPRECTYFIRIGRKLRHDVENFSEDRAHNQLNSLLIADMSDGSGAKRAVRQSYVDTPGSATVWSGDLLDVVRVPASGRRLTPVASIDDGRLAGVIRRRRLRVADLISPAEYERYYLDERLRDAGIRTVRPAEANAALIVAADFEAFNGTFDSRAILWSTHAAKDGYNFYLVPAAVAQHIIASRRGKTLWTLAERQPLRTLLTSSTNGRFFTARVFRPDRELRLALATGPSLLRRTSTFRAFRLDGEAEPLFFTVTAPSQVISIPVRRFWRRGETSAYIVVEPSPQPEQRVMPADDRMLTYLLLDCELDKPDDPLYTPRMKYVLNANLTGYTGADIVDRASSQALALGAGWFGREQQGSTAFRWMGSHADLVFESTKTTARVVALTGQVGPAAEDGRVTITAALNGSKALSEEVDYDQGKVNVRFDLEAPEFRKALKRGQNLLSLSTTGIEHRTADPRLLTFRVFHVGLVDEAASVGVRTVGGSPATDER